MKVVISGPTGAIGRALIDHCLKCGDEVLAICHRNSRRINSFPVNDKFKILELNLNEYKNYINNIDYPRSKYDVFYNLAWEGTTGKYRNDADLQMKNILYSIDAVRLAYYFGCEVFVGAGSQAEFGRVDGILKANTPCFPDNGYGIAKLSAGYLTRLKCEEIKLKHIWVRILSVYGPYDNENSMIMSSLKKMISKETIELTMCEQKWDYLFSYDAAHALRLLGINGVNGKVYILANGTSRKLSEYVKIMSDILCYPDDKILFGAIPYSDKQVMKLEADISELVEDIGYRPDTSFEEGIRLTKQYLLN